MSDNKFEAACARYMRARADFTKLCAVAAETNIDADADAACDELTAAEWDLTRTPARGDFATIQQRARMVQEMLNDTEALAHEELFGAALAVLIAEIIEYGGRPSGDAEIERLQGIPISPPLLYAAASPKGPSSRAIRCTVPVPTPTCLATFNMPLPAFRRPRIRFSTSAELSERASDLKNQLAHRRRGVDRLLIEVQIDAARFERLDRAQEVKQRTAEAVDCPGHDDVELAPLGILEHLIEPRPLIPALGTRDTGITVRYTDDFPSGRWAISVSARIWFSTVCLSVLTRT
jgi:hypothetical protein